MKLKGKYGSNRITCNLRAGINQIGRDLEADFFISLSFISRRHAEVHVENNKVYLLDLDSKGGTYVNGLKLEPFFRVELKHGDLIALHHLPLVYEEGGLEHLNLAEQRLQSLENKLLRIV